MKKTFAILCSAIGIYFSAPAQNILSLKKASINDVKVITPVLSNLFTLIKASKEDFVATVTSLNYAQSKPDDPNTYRASGTDQVYNVDKEDKDVDIFFSDNGDYAKKAKDVFLAAHPGARHRSMDGGIEAYYFDMTEGGSPVHYCIFFDLPADGGGGVTLLALD